MSGDLNQESTKIELANINKLLQKHQNQVFKVVMSIILFLIIYFSLLGAALLLVYGAIVLGLDILRSFPHFLTLVAVIGLWSLAGMFFIFIIKFVFKFQRNHDPLRIEITENEFPELFALIQETASEAQAPFPNKVFLNYDVNAGVFYNSSFLSLFLPTRKNLQIGLGLINCVNVSELKAILAHEFGHFSQRSMKAGSYIYTVNHMIYDMVNTYDKWDELLQSWASTGGIFGFFGLVTGWMAELVRIIMRKTYQLINLPYMKLSRIMEFQADRVAAGVVGGKVMIDALRRVDFGHAAFEFTNDQLNKLIQKEKFSDNIYINHAENIKFMITSNELLSENDLPLITDNDMKVYTSSSKIVIDDQWASHPSQPERESNLSDMRSDANTNRQSAWSLFEQPEDIQQRMTRHLYSVAIEDKSTIVYTDSLEIQKQIREETNRFKIDPCYFGYYNKAIEPFDLDAVITEVKQQLTEKDIFSLEVKNRLESLSTKNADLLTLEQLIASDIKYFDYDGIKYKRRDAPKLRKQLKEEIVEESEWSKQLDRSVFSFYYHMANDAQREKYRQAYELYFFIGPCCFEIEEQFYKMQYKMNDLFSQRMFNENEVRNGALDINASRSAFSQFLDNINSKNWPDNVGEISIEDGIGSYLGIEKIVSLPINQLDADLIIKLNNQLAQVYEKLVDLLDESLLSIIAIQDTVMNRKKTN